MSRVNVCLWLERQGGDPVACPMRTPPPIDSRKMSNQYHSSMALGVQLCIEEATHAIVGVMSCIHANSVRTEVLTDSTNTIFTAILQPDKWETLKKQLVLKQVRTESQHETQVQLPCLSFTFSGMTSLWTLILVPLMEQNGLGGTVLTSKATVALWNSHCLLL
jgi:hypothetical protein